MRQATIAMAYYENPQMLHLHLVEWSKYREEDKALLSAIIVDDGSPRNPAADVIKAYGGDVGFPIKLFRILENKPWNQDGARNLAMTYATGWVLLTDMDHMLARGQAPGFLCCVNAARWVEYYMPDRVTFAMVPEHSHANSYVMHSAAFWKAGGYDEDFSGAYGSDGNFRKCMRSQLRECATHEFHLMRWSRDDISDASTTDWGRKNSAYHRSNFPALEAKSRGPAYKAVDHLRFNWERVL